MEQFKQFSNRGKITGYTKKPDLQQQKKDKKYLNLRVPEPTVKSLGLEPGQLVEILVRTQNGNTKFFKNEVGETSSSDYKFYVPRDVVKELDLDENSLVDVFISKD